MSPIKKISEAPKFFDLLAEADLLKIPVESIMKREMETEYFCGHQNPRTGTYERKIRNNAAWLEYQVWLGRKNIHRFQSQPVAQDSEAESEPNWEHQLTLAPDRKDLD